MKTLFLAFFITLSFLTHAQDKNEQAIRQVLASQTQSWNHGDIDGFMQGYWKSDSMMFVGQSGVNWGWQKTLENYKKGYPDTTAMGKLAFDIIMVKKLSNEYYYVVGKWLLKRTIGDAGGYFDLLFQKIKGNWYIIADHSS